MGHVQHICSATLSPSRPTNKRHPAISKQFLRSAAYVHSSKRHQHILRHRNTSTSTAAAAAAAAAALTSTTAVSPVSPTSLSRLSASAAKQRHQPRDGAEPTKRAQHRDSAVWRAGQAQASTGVETSVGGQIVRLVLVGNTRASSGRASTPHGRGGELWTSASCLRGAIGCVAERGRESTARSEHCADRAMADI